MIARRARPIRWRLETLERRDQPAIFTVTTTADSGAGSLREALLGSQPVGSDTINFQIPGPGPYTIQPLSALPTLPDAIVLDGTTQSGWAVGAPVIELNGALAGKGVAGLTLVGNFAVVRGLVINRFDGAGIAVNDGYNVTIAGCFIGTNQAGTVMAENVGPAIAITGGAGKNNNVAIGGPAAADRNVIVDSGGENVTVSKVGGTVIRNNIFGLDKTASVDITTGTAINVGIYLDGSTGATTIRDNIISGQNYAGIFAGQMSAALLITGNTIGLNGAGTAGLGNTNYGIQLVECKNATIGGTTAADRNVIGGNGRTATGAGIDLRNCSNTVVAGNYVGTDAAGMAAIPNLPFGVNVYSGSTTVVIGGTAPGAGNLISGNGSTFAGAGLAIDNTNGVNVVGNAIGLNAVGTGTIGNLSFGVWLKNGARNTTVGGTSAAARNVVVGNGSSVNGFGAGIRIQDTATVNNTVLGNWVGLRPDGAGLLPNLFNGIEFESAGTGNVIGGAAAGAGNLILGNGVTAGVGLRISGEQIAVVGNTVGGSKDDGVFLDAANATTLSRNMIGYAADGSTPLPNGRHGIWISGGSGSSIGGVTNGNIVAFNSGAGIAVNGSAVAHTIRGNSIFGNTKIGIDLGNDGVSGNDPMDADGGANNTQNFPLVTAATGGPTTSVAGTLAASATAHFDLDIYAIPADPAVAMRFLGSANAITDGAGNATFSVSGLPATFGGERVVVTATDAAGNTSEFCPAFVISGPAKPPARVSAIKVDDGTSQRSLVRSVTVTFDQQLDAGITAAAFSLARQGGGTVNLAASVNYFGLTTAVTLTFTGGEVDGVSLKNGRYNLTIDASKITTGNNVVNLDGNGDGVGGDNYVLITTGNPIPSGIWRLFGDVDGDNDVDSSDFGQFRLAYGGAGSLFDFDNDGDTDTADFGRFRSGYGGSI